MARDGERYEKMLESVFVWAALAFAAGWLLRGLERRRKIHAARESRQREFDDLQSRIALERLRADNLERALRQAAPTATDPEPATPEPSRPYLARPRIAASDSTAARA